MSKYRYGKRTSTVTSTRYVKEVIQTEETLEDKVQTKIELALNKLSDLKSELVDLEDKVSEIKQSISEVEDTVAEVESLF